MRVKNRTVIRSVLLAGLSWVLVLAIPGCDFSSSPSDAGGGDGTGPFPPVTPGGPVTSPILYGVTPQLLCAGTRVTLEGVNFPSDPNKIRVNFTAGVVRIPGLPIRVEFPSDNNPQNGLESRLTVLVPGGISPGNVELIADGIYAGANGYAACPQLLVYALDRNEQGRFLRHLGPLGFEQPSFVRLYGIGFVEIEEVILEDSGGQTARILPSTIERDTVAPGGVGTGAPPPTGYTSIGFSLRDGTNNVSLTIATNRRDNIKVKVRTSSGTTNALEIPVLNTSLQPLRTGAAINGVKVPTGVSTGPVRIHYSMSDLASVVNTPYRIEVEWSVDGGGTWFPATYDATDPEGSGATGVLPGTIFTPSGHRLFPTGGAVRCFTWDAQKDPGFVSLNTPQTGQTKPPREWQVEFRIRPVSESPAVQMLGYAVTTPRILYYYIPSADAGTPDEERAKAFVEGFVSQQYAEFSTTTASWGPPNNPGSLIGLPPGSSPTADQFGSGTADIKISKVPQEDLPLGIIDQYYVIDTDQVQIQQVFVDENDPADPADDILLVSPVEFDNPGASRKEFHVRRLFVCPEVRVDVIGANPLIFRSRGLLEPLTAAEEAAEMADPCLGRFPEGTVFGILEGNTFDLNGRDGAAGGAGGAGGPGGGAGGAGGTATVGNMAEIAAVTHGQPGANSGGGGGETSGGVDQDITGGRTQFPGGPGAGGGHRLAGGVGDPGTPAPTRFRPSRGGLAGPPRGEARQVVLTGGSGGGGGGAGLQSTDGLAYTVQNGAGGGGGGGAFKAVASGTIYMDPSASIQCNGGAGGAAGSAVGSNGGGGSGGSIVLQASGPVDVSCASLQVAGGLKGRTLTVQNKIPGAGDGAPGWVRIESSEGGAPTCNSFAAVTTLGATLSQREIARITVASTVGFPEQGTVLIEGEEIRYERITDTTLEVLDRPVPTAHSAGADVVLMGAIAPYSDQDVWSEMQVVASPDIHGMGRARDGELSLNYEPGVDPDTGEVALDPETGQAVAIYRFDTDLGVITAPNERVVLEVAAADSDPGFLDLSQLRIEQRVTLRCTGSRGVRIGVRGEADIGGTIDVSGVAGGILIFPDEDPRKPLPGVGGSGGPGGGAGGLGGSIHFVDGDVLDKSDANVIPINGSPAGPIPGFPPGYDKTPAPYGDGSPADGLAPFPAYTRATPGLSMPAQGCGGPGEGPCILSAGGGGGGGDLRAGTKGNSVTLMTEDLGGGGGSALGNPSFRWNGDFWVYGGTGGAGGGAAPHVSSQYLSGIPGSYTYKGLARFAPGTGGGGGGGALILVAANLYLRDSARILARGGDAYQSIDLGGNGGGGAGGTVFIQVENALTVEQGAVIDVSGGRSNQPVPVDPVRRLQPYEGNIRQVGTNVQSFGGNGGVGSPGRVRIEAAIGSLALRSGRNSSVTVGPLYLDVHLTVANSLQILLGLGPGKTAKSPRVTVLPQSISFFDFGQPIGTGAVVVWLGARESLDQHGAPSTFVQGVRDADLLQHREFVKFRVFFLSNALTGETQSIRQIELPYTLRPR